MGISDRFYSLGKKIPLVRSFIVQSEFERNSEGNEVVENDVLTLNDETDSLSVSTSNSRLNGIKTDNNSNNNNNSTISEEDRHIQENIDENTENIEENRESVGSTCNDLVAGASYGNPFLSNSQFHTQPFPIVPQIPGSMNGLNPYPYQNINDRNPYNNVPIYNNDQAVTNSKDIIGWIFSSWAAEPFTVCGMGSYIPILLESYARANSVLASDHSIPCSLSSSPRINGVFQGEDSNDQCVVKFLGIYMTTSSFSLYSFSFSVFLQAICVITLSGVADKGHYRKSLLVACAVLGSFATIWLSAIPQAYYYLLPLSIGIANSSFGVVSVCGNSFLPFLVRFHPDTIRAFSESSDLTEFSDSTDNYMLMTETSRGIMSRLSGLGTALGYSGALIVQCISILMTIKTGSLSYAIFFIGFWWLLFNIPVQLLLRPHFLNEIISLDNGSESQEQHSIKYLLTYGWKALKATIHEIRYLKDMCYFLAGWFLLSDGSTTINSAAILFAKTELNMDSAHLAGIGLFVMVFGIIGAMTITRYIQPILKLSPVGTVLLSVSIVILIPAYGILGFFSNNIGFHNSYEMYIMAAFYGLGLGGINSACRSLFSLLIPPGKESTYFSLYSITDKGSSIVGPFIAGIILDRFHKLRLTFLFLLFVLVFSVPFFYFMDVDRGQSLASYNSIAIDEDISDTASEAHLERNSEVSSETYSEAYLEERPSNGYGSL